MRPPSGNVPHHPFVLRVIGACRRIQTLDVYLPVLWIMDDDLIRDLAKEVDQVNAHEPLLTVKVDVFGVNSGRKVCHQGIIDERIPLVADVVDHSVYPVGVVAAVVPAMPCSCVIKA